jgi:hypothetical protein
MNDKETYQIREEIQKDKKETEYRSNIEVCLNRT